ncbi:MAG: hypothetical protein ACW987_10540 [Candidatus Thorarchaeota archaeon]|jgi:hypothetical protein
MAWYLDTVRIFVQETAKTWDQISAELNPLAGGSIVHNFGYSEEKRNVNAYVIGETDEAALLSGPYGASSYLVKNVVSTQVPVSCQSLRPDLDDDAPVFLIDFELWADA